MSLEDKQTRLGIPLRFQHVPFPDRTCFHPSKAGPGPPGTTSQGSFSPRACGRCCSPTEPLFLQQQRPCNYCHLLNMTTEAGCN